MMRSTDKTKERTMTNATTKKAAPKIATALQAKLDACTTTAAKIRLLDAEKMAKGDIARALNIRYQWVRNVLNAPLKKEG